MVDTIRVKDARGSERDVATIDALIAAEQALTGVLPIAVGGSAIAAGRMWSANITVAGNVTITYADESSHVVPVVTGYQRFPDSITGISASTATGTYANHY